MLLWAAGEQQQPVVGISAEAGRSAGAAEALVEAGKSAAEEQPGCSAAVSAG